MEYSELKNKVVININTGEKIGYIFDLLIKIPEGQITSLLISPLKNKYLKTTILELSWKYIILIGIDTILVDIKK